MDSSEIMRTAKKVQQQFRLPENVKPYASRLNLILLGLVLWSAYHVVDLNNSIKRETHAYGKAQEEEIRLNQDFAELQYEHSQAVDAKLVGTAAKEMNMREPNEQETVVLRLR